MRPVLVLVLALAVPGLACSRSNAATEEPAAKAAPAAPRPAGNPAGLPQLVFFMNPNGMPCQMQDRVLKDMEGELKDKVHLVYYRTDQGEDREMFARFGIRALPSLVFTDAEGKEIRRGAPGIQAADQVRQLITR